MPEANKAKVTRRVVRQGSDAITAWLWWAAGLGLLMVIALGIYAAVTGAFGAGAPRTAEEATLAESAALIRENPQNGAAYAQYAEALFEIGRENEAYKALDDGEKAVGDATPALAYVLHSRTLLLNREGRYAEAEKVGMRAMNASDEYMARQIKEMVAKGLSTAGADSSISVASALQLARAYAGQEKWDKAVQLYDYALMYEPTAGDIYTLRGWAYVGMGAETSATADFKETLKYLPDDPSALEGLKEIEAK